MTRSLLAISTVLLAAAALAASPASAAPGDDPLQAAGREPTAAEIAASISEIEIAASISRVDLDRAVIAIDVDSSVVGVERPAEDPGVITLESDILFGFGSADLSPAARAAVSSIAGRLAGTTRQVQVVGHTDSVGSDADNLTLSQRRADAVAAALREAAGGVQVVATGRGEAEPVAPNESGGQDDPAGRALNRRVEIRTG